MRADGRDGLGPIPTGRGGANQAFSDNAEMILDNPASMVNVTEGRGLIELGVATATTTGQYSNSFGADVNAKVRPAPGPVLGITRKTPDGQWAFGIGLFAPDSFGADFGEVDTAVFGPSPMSSRGDSVKLVPAVAYRATDRLALGASLGIGLSYASFNGPQFLQTGPLSGMPILIDARGTGVAPVGAIGMQYQLTDDTRIGATYTTQSNFWLRGATNATFVDGFPIESRFDSKMRLRWPGNLAFGIKHDLSPRRRIATDLVWTNWSRAFSNFNLILSDPSNPAVHTLLNSFGGSLPIHQDLPLNWSNTVTFRFGFETDLGDSNVLRLGYDYQPNPSPNPTFNPYFGGGMQQAFSLGLSHKLRHTTLNAAYQYAFGPARYVGDSTLVGGEFTASTYQADAHYATMSLSIPY